MTKFSILFALFFAFTSRLSAQEVFNILTPQLLCSETCQHWDKFNEVCQYKTSCSIEGTLVTATQCTKWDNFNDVCQNEAVSRRYVKFDTSTGSPECVETCQYENNFGDCLYRTSCSVTTSCASLTKCQYWDKFNEVCQSESTDHVCNLR